MTTVTTLTYEEKCLNQAKKEYPKDAVCGRCKKENNFADDCGFFYWNSSGKFPFEDKDYIPVCRSCWNELGLTTGER